MIKLIIISLATLVLFSGCSMKSNYQLKRESAAKYIIDSKDKYYVKSAHPFYGGVYRLPQKFDEKFRGSSVNVSYDANKFCKSKGWGVVRGYMANMTSLKSLITDEPNISSKGHKYYIKKGFVEHMPKPDKDGQVLVVGGHEKVGGHTITTGVDFSTGEIYEYKYADYFSEYPKSELFPSGKYGIAICKIKIGKKKY
jgi:hypothetical protein